MVKKLLFIILMYSGPSSFAQGSYIGKSDPEAKKVLDQVSSKFKTYKSVVAKFTLTIENSDGKILGTKTGVVNMKGSKYRIDVSGQEIYSDGNDVWTYDKSSNEVQVTKFDGSGMITPQKMFTNFYDKDFLYKLNESNATGTQMKQVELTPIDKTKPVFKVLVNIDNANKTITSTKLFEKNGNRYSYSVVSLKTNTPLPDAMFVYDPKRHPNVEVVDLR